MRMLNGNMPMPMYIGAQSDAISVAAHFTL